MGQLNIFAILQMGQLNIFAILQMGQLNIFAFLQRGQLKHYGSPKVNDSFYLFNKYQELL